MNEYNKLVSDIRSDYTNTQTPKHTKTGSDEGQLLADVLVIHTLSGKMVSCCNDPVSN